MKEKKTVVAFGKKLTDEEFILKSNEIKASKIKDKVRMQRKRQRLYAKIKHFTTIKPKQREIHMTEDIFNNCAEDQKNAIKALVEVYKFNVQFSII